MDLQLEAMLSLLWVQATSHGLLNHWRWILCAADAKEDNKSQGCQCVYQKFPSTNADLNFVSDDKDLRNCYCHDY